MKIKAGWSDAHEGTGLQGYIETNYEDIVEAYGPPTAFDIDGKVQIEWELLLDGEPVTIYDWKTSMPVQQVQRWNVGGKKKDAVFMAWAGIKGARVLT